MITTTDALKTIISYNSGRDYPLDPSVSLLPVSIFVDAEISVPFSFVSDYGDFNFKLFISNVVITSNDMSVYISAYNNDTQDILQNVAYGYSTYDNLKDRHILAVASTDDSRLAGISGNLYVGDIDTFMQYAGSYSLTISSGALSDMCIHAYPDMFTGFQVGNTVISGDAINLEAGEGIQLSVNDNGHIVISLTEDMEDYLLHKRGDLIDAIVKKYGEPVCTINGMPPNNSCDFSIQTDGETCSSVDIVQNGIAINNPCATTCCDKSFLDSVLENINELNARSSRLTNYLTTVTNNLNNLSNELAMLKLNINQQ